MEICNRICQMKPHKTLIRQQESFFKGREKSMNDTSTLNGPNYSVNVPAGFNLLNADPFSGKYWLLPPGSNLFEIPAIVQIRPVMPFELPMLLKNLYGLDDPLVAMANAANLGLANITGINPVRQINMPQGQAHIREFEAITNRGYPARVMALAIQGTSAAVEVIIMINLYRWVEFIAPCLEFIGRINLSGATAASGQVRAVVDKNHPDQIEYQLVNSDNTVTPITALPTAVGNITIINIDNSIKTGNINGTGVVVGNHSTAKVT